MSVLLKNIRQLVLVSEDANQRFLINEAMRNPKIIEDAWLFIDGDKVISYGSMQTLNTDFNANEIVDCKGRLVLPGWVDSHTHALFLGTREHEMVMKLQGESYEAIAARGGGILSTVKHIRQASESQLLEQAVLRLKSMLHNGTTTVEIKSGYGLDFDSEIKMLRVIQQLKNYAKQKIYVTFLGAHTFPPEFKNNRDGYMKLLLEKMLPYIAEHQLADFVDVFCETNFFTVQESELILENSLKYGLQLKVHANELDYSGGVQVGVKYGAASVDHLECVGEAEVSCLQGSQTVATLLPTTAFYLRLPYAPARKLIDNRVIVSLASDFNPGTSPNSDMMLVNRIACLQMKMLPEETIVASTLNAAYALRDEQVGSLAVGKNANLIITKPFQNLYQLFYFFGEPIVERVMVSGKWA